MLLNYEETTLINYSINYIYIVIDLIANQKNN